MNNHDTAWLGNRNGYTVFRFGDRIVRFKAPSSLEHYTEIKEYDNGYLVVMAKYRHNDAPEEEYIDLVPILENLYFDADTFLSPIRKVCVSDGEH